MKNKILLALISFLISLLTLEAAIRVLSNYSYEIKILSFYKYDNSRLGQINTLESLIKNAPFPMKPGRNRGGFILNSKGFRTPEYQLQKSPNSLRIITIGDSFTFQSGPVPYPYHWTRVLQDRLQSSFTQTPVELINLALPAIGPKFEQKILEIEGIRLKPDLIILAFFVGNDFFDESVGDLEKGFSLKHHIFMRCYLCRLIRNKYILYYSLQTPEAHKLDQTIQRPSGTYVGNPRKYDATRPSHKKTRFMKIQTDRMRIYSEKSFPWRHYTSVQRTLLDIRNTCREFELPLLIVILPDQNQVDPYIQREVLKKLGKTVEDLRMDLPQLLLADFFRNNDIAYLDLLPTFKGQAAEQRLYHLQDTHWSIDGNRLAAEAIFKHLRDVKLVGIDSELVEWNVKDKD